MAHARPGATGLEILRVLDVAAAAGVEGASLPCDALPSVHAAAVTTALSRMATGTAAPPRTVASLRQLAIAAASRQAGSQGKGTLPPAALGEAQQEALYGMAYLPDDVACDVARVWADSQPPREGVPACKTAHPDESLIKGTLQCAHCQGPVFRMAPATHPRHHLYLESAAGRLTGRGRVAPDSPGGRFWAAVGAAGVATIAAMAAANVLRVTLHRRARAARDAAAETERHTSSVAA